MLLKLLITPCGNITADFAIDNAPAVRPQNTRRERGPANSIHSLDQFRCMIGFTTVLVT